MKLIKLSSDDPDIFNVEISAEKCEFLVKNFEAFMQMYKSQGSTFWLRFLMCFKNFTEEKLCHSKQWLSDIMNHFQFIRVLNYIYINVHKKFIEGSNTAVKKLINNLMTLSLNSPHYLHYSCEQWLLYIKGAKHLHTTLQNIFGTIEPSDCNGFTAFVYTIYTDFFSAIVAVFEHWHREKDLSEEDAKKIDSKLIYWLPPYDSNCKIKPLCFEKYLSDHWKEDLQRLLLKDNIHNSFGTHERKGCCEKFDKDKNIFRVFKFSDRMDFMQAIYNRMAGDDEEEVETDLDTYTMTEVCMKDIGRLKPQGALCTDHKNKCFVRIIHSENCCEPFLCKGDSPCVLTCETELKKKIKVKKEKFWKTVSAQSFSVKEKKRDVATQAESVDREIQTYLHLRDIELEFPFSMLKHTYHQCMAELYNFDFNPRKTECLNRLRKKLSEKNPSSLLQLNPNILKDPEFHKNLLEDATAKIRRMKESFCLANGHIYTKCKGKCFAHATNSVSISSSNAFGRVISLSRSSIIVPSEVHCCEEMCYASNQTKNKSSKKSDAKKNKSNGTADAKPLEDSTENDCNEDHCVSSCKKNKNSTNKNKDNFVTNESSSKEKNTNKDNSKANERKESNASQDSEESDCNKKGNNADKGNTKVNKSSKKRKKANKNTAGTDSIDNSNKNAECSGITADISDNTLNLGESSNVVEEKEYSEINIDDDVDEILKLIGIGEDDDDEKDDDDDDDDEKEDDIGENGGNASKMSPYEAVENFFKLIGVKDDTLSDNVKPSDASETVNCDKTKLRTCAYCKKKETQRKMFKKCSRCKEENFPVQHYYCSPECLMEDWTETHEEEHLRFKKH